MDNRFMMETDEDDAYVFEREGESQEEDFMESESEGEEEEAEQLEEMKPP
nr:hypothetical protein [Tanacetum cinerariifolium]